MNKNVIKNIIRKHNLKIIDFDYYTNEIIKIKKILPKNKMGKLVIVTAMNSSPVGEGKTTTAIGIIDSLNKLNVQTIGCLREPSLGPVFGKKGTGSGSGKSKLLPFDKINLHFTGDINAIEKANNLISAVIDNEIYYNSSLNIDPNQILWKRCIDINDRSLRNITINLGDNSYNTSFNITAASDMMSLFCLSKNKIDFINKLESTIIAYSRTNTPIYLKQLEITEAIIQLLKDAFYPNLVRTCENNPVIVHGGPFANISNGCSSLISIQTGLKLADVCVTEAGFGSDLGFEKFMNITCKELNCYPNVVVIVVSLKSVLFNGQSNDLNGIKLGIKNIIHHINHIKKYNINNILVTVNKRSDDDINLFNQFINLLSSLNIDYCINECWQYGSSGGIEMGNKIINLLNKPINNIKSLYSPSDSLENKINMIIKNSYGAKKVIYSPVALKKLEQYNHFYYYVCIAKNPFSLTDDPNKIGVMSDFDIHINDIDINHAAKLIIPITSVVYKMPGLPKQPNAKHFIMK